MNDIRIKIEGLEELTEAVKALAGMTCGQMAPAPTPAIPSGAGAIPQQQVSASVENIPSYGQTPVLPVASPGMGMPVHNGSAVPAATVPITAMPREYTIEQLQVAAAGLSNIGRMPQVMGILQRFGIQAMTELPKERFGEFAIALREAGAQI